MAELRRIAVHPVKSLDPTTVERVRVVENGGLAGDREYALFDGEGRYVNGKRTAAVHRIRAEFEGIPPDPGDDGEAEGDETGGGGPESGAVWLGREGGDRRRFDLDADRERLSGWLGDHLGVEVHLKRDRRGGFPDDTALSGPTVISTATVEEVASWFPGVDPEGMRLRLRANLEVGGVEPFWEDRLYAAEGREVAFRVGDVELRGGGPCRRCVVPTRDPHTGESHEGFRETFVERRERTLPGWAERSRFGDFFRVMVNTRVPESEWGGTLSVGDEVEILGERPAP